MPRFFVRAVCIFFLSFLYCASAAFARDWNTTDSDLPDSLKDLSQSQLNIINKVNELNPAHKNFNQGLFDMFMRSQQNPPVIRTGEGTQVLPNVGTDTQQDAGGTPTGIGNPPAASDGPTSHPGPVGDPSAENKGAGGTRGLFTGEFPHVRMSYNYFWYMISGSGGLFGDCIGADCIPHIGRNGYPLGGPPFGSWTYFDRSSSNFRFINDQSFLQDIARGNFTGIESSLGSILGGSQVKHDPRGRGF